MASQKKIVIITSDENLIQQLSLHKTLNTRIIDLDDNNHSASTTNDNTDVTDLAFLAQLSQPKSICEHVDKHVLESPQDNGSKVAKMTEKNNCTVCVVCGDHASGFNYGALTCASCKTFFRRNALQPSEKIRCLEGRGTCFVSHDMRRKCQQCRLKRCFATGMRKDYFVSEEEKQRRRKRLLDSMHHSTVLLPSTKITSPSVPLPSSTQVV